MHLSPFQQKIPLNFASQNLRGHSFRGRKDLAGADFSYADIRGADFTNANLRGANFCHVKAGLQQHRKIGLVLVSLLLTALSGFVLAYAGAATTMALYDQDLNKVFSGLVDPITLLAGLRQKMRQKWL